MEDTPQKHDYIISSYEPLADLFFLYFNIGPNNNKTKINNQKKCSSRGQIRILKKKKKSKKNYVFIKI